MPYAASMTMTRRGGLLQTCCAALALALVGLGSACSSAPPIPREEALQRLADAEARMEAGDPEAAVDDLEDVDRESFPPLLRERRDLVLARAQRATGDDYEAFVTLREFSDRYPHSELRDTVVQMVYDIGRTLIRSDAGFLFFWSDRRAGQSALEHLITRYPDNPWLADALRLLGDDAFERDDLALAQERYRDILRRRPDSEWAPYARFRYAMSLYGTLQGAEYDQDQMLHAQRELTDYLAGNPENPEFVAIARKSLDQILVWRSDRELLVARFYEEIGNEPGRLRHLELAAAEEFATTDAGKEARAILAAPRQP